MEHIYKIPLIRTDARNAAVAFAATAVVVFCVHLNPNE